MKNYFLAFASTILLFSCSKNNDDDDHSTINEHDIIGEWIIEENFEDGELIPMLDPCSLESRLFFTADSVKISQYGGNDCEDVLESTRSYTLNPISNVLFIFNNGLPEHAKILLLNANAFHFSTIIDEKVYEYHYLRP